MTVVESTALDAGKAAIPLAQIRITLVTGSSTLPGYTAAGELIGPHTVKADETGAWSVDLTPTSQITPANSYYEFWESGAVSIAQVPASGGPYQLKDILVTAPPTPASPGITGVQVAAAGTVAGSRPEVNFVAGSNIAVSATDDSTDNRVNVSIGFTGAVGPAPATTVTDGTAYGQTKAVGTDGTFAREDHAHGTPPAPPAATTATAGLVQLGSNAAALKPEGKADPGGTGQAADLGHVHPHQPWVFDVTAYGAKLDLQCVLDGSMTTGGNVITSPSGPFLPAHNGQTFAVKGALSNGNAGIGVGTYLSATQMQVTFTATAASPTNLQVVWGTDDTNAIQQATDAGMTYSSPFGIAAEVHTPASDTGYGVMIAGPLKTTDQYGSAVFHSQITIALHSDRAAKKRIAFTGVGDAGDCRHWNQDFPAFGGSTWFSACLPFTTLTQQQTGPDGVSTLGNPAILGGPTGKAGYGVSATNPAYSNVTVSMRDMTLMNAHSVNGWTIMPFNFHGMAGCHLDRCTYGTSGVVQYYTGAGGSGGNADFSGSLVNSLSGGISIGGLLPAAGNNASNRIRDCVWNGGYTYGPVWTEHTTGDGNVILYCWSGFCPAGNYGDGGVGAGALHAISAGQLCVEGCAYQVNVFGAAASNRGPYVHAILDTEGSRQIRDNPSNGTALAAMRGEIRFTGSPGVPALTFPTTCRIILEENAPGVAASPPALVINTAVMNNTGRPAEVYLSGGAGLTTVQVSDLMWGAAAPAVNTRPGMDFTTGGTIPAGTKVRLAPGQWIKVNGTGTPTLPTALWVLE